MLFNIQYTSSFWQLFIYEYNGSQSILEKKFHLLKTVWCELKKQLPWTENI